MVSQEPAQWSAPLRALERRLDGAAWRMAFRVAALWRARRRERRVATPVDLAAAIGDPHASFEGLMVALRYALTAGALDSAGRILQRLLATELSSDLSPPSAALLVDASLMLGEQEWASAWAERWHDSLSASALGSGLLELLGSTRGGPWLRDGRPNLVHLARQVAGGALGPAELVELLASKPELWRAEPELHLLCFAALRRHAPAVAGRFLNRFLRAHALTPCRSGHVADSGALLLGGLSFEAADAVSDGPLVSVLMAVRDRVDTLRYAVDSLLRQSYRQLEILIGDDASQDGSWDLLQQLYASNGRVRLFRSSANQGAYNVRNGLAEQARGQLITCHDADDLALPERIARQVARLRRHAAPACVTSWLRFAPSGDVVWGRDQRATRMSTVSLMLTREALARVGPFRSARVGADAERYADIVAHFGPQAIERIHAPLIFALWSDTSATRLPGLEALEDGYRSPARRGYSEAIFAKHHGMPQPDIDEYLRASDNYRSPTPLVEASRRG